MNDETGSKNNPIGLYQHKESGKFLGALDSASANAYVQVGYRLVEEGREAALRPDPDAPETDDELDEEPDTTQSNARGGR